MKIIVRNVKYISKTIKIIASRYIIRLNLFGVEVIIIDVESLGFLNFRDQALLEIIPRIILNVFDVKYKVEVIFSTG